MTRISLKEQIEKSMEKVNAIDTSNQTASISFRELITKKNRFYRAIKKLGFAGVKEYFAPYVDEAIKKAFGK